MKILILRLLFVFVFSSSVAQENKNHIYTKTQIEEFINEVYAEQADLLVFKSSSDRLKLLTSFIERVTISEMPQYSGKKFQLLSSVALLNKYNHKLRRDAVYNANTFNPLKYKFPMFSRSKEVFRVDGTDILIVIEPMK